MSSSPEIAISQPPHDPLEESEVVMRRFLNSKQHYKTKKTPPLQEKAFHPRESDDTGISISRRFTEKRPYFLNEHQFRSLAPEPIASTCGVCGFTAQFCANIGATITLDPIDTDRGHALLSQITYQDFFSQENSEEATRKQIIARKLIYELTIEANKNILIPPATS